MCQFIVSSFKKNPLRSGIRIALDRNQIIRVQSKITKRKKPIETLTAAKRGRVEFFKRDEKKNQSNNAREILQIQFWKYSINNFNTYNYFIIIGQAHSNTFKTHLQIHIKFPNKILVVFTMTAFRVKTDDACSRVPR